MSSRAFKRICASCGRGGRFAVLLCAYCEQSLTCRNMKVHLEYKHDFEVKPYKCPTCHLEVAFRALDISEAEDVTEGPIIHVARCPRCQQCFGDTGIVEAAKNRPVAESQQPVYLVLAKTDGPSNDAPMTIQDADEAMEVDDEKEQLGGENKREFPNDNSYGPGPCPKMAKQDKN